MRSADAEDFGAPSWVDAADLPLFDDPRPGPFAQSKAAPTAVEAALAQVIWEHPGRKRPISIAEIIAHFDSKIALSDGPDRLTPRMVKEIVEQLRVAHGCPVGAVRGEPGGYYWIMDADDLEAAVRPYREQIKTMWRTLAALESAAKVREFWRELRPEE